jgi:hypothetical protein
VTAVQQLAFDGVTMPRITVEMAFGSTATEDLRAAGVFILGESFLDGPDVLGSLSWAEVSEDVKSLRYAGGFSDDTSGASPGTSTLVLDNSDGFYDPTVAESPSSGTVGVYPSTSRYPNTTEYPMPAPVEGPTEASEIDVGKPVQVTFTWADGNYRAFTHYVDRITVDAGQDPTVTFECVDGLDALGRAPVPEVPLAFGGDTSDQRLGRILDLAQWPTSMRSVETGLLTLEATTFGGQALPLAQEVTDTEQGRLFVDADGKVVFYNRMHVYTAARSLTVQATISDQGGAATEMVELAVTKDRARVYNHAAVTRAAEGAVEQVATDPASIAKYGIRSYPGQVGTLVPTDADAYALASWLVSQYGLPRTEVRQVTIDATAQGTWSELLPLQLFDRIRVVRDYGPVTIDRELLIFGYEVSITAEPMEWTITYSTVDPTTFVPFVLGTSVLGGTHRLA